MPLRRLAKWLPILTVSLCSCTVGRMVIYGFSDIRDYKKFPERELTASADPFRFGESDGDYIRKKDIRVTHDLRHEPLDSLLLRSNTVAFLIIQNDILLYENYLLKYTESSKVASFSMAKSYTSALVGIAISEGHISGIEDRMVDYLPELKSKGMDEVRIKHLLQMTSGIHHQENYYNPFAGVARLYYGKQLSRQIRHIGMDMEPGHYYKYKSINTQLLGEIVARATGKSLTQYLDEKIWKPMGMEHEAGWSIDQSRGGMEKAFCCINATARDFAKFGWLYLHNGTWEGKQIVPREWVEASTQVNAQDGAVWYYQYQWWLPSKEGDYYAAGHLGQYIYVNPVKDLIIVRLGKNEGKVRWARAFREIAAQL